MNTLLTVVWLISQLSVCCISFGGGGGGAGATVAATATNTEPIGAVGAKVEVAEQQTSSTTNADDDADNYLDVFSTKLLFRTEPGPSSSGARASGSSKRQGRPTTFSYSGSGGGSEPPLVLEIEETYDQYRGLAKVVVRENNGARGELYVRLQDSLYLEARFSTDGALAGCWADQKRPTSGHFGLFAPLVELAESMAITNQQPHQQHLIGPSALLYSFQDELRAEKRRRQTEEGPPESRHQNGDHGDTNSNNNNNKTTWPPPSPKTTNDQERTRKQQQQRRTREGTPDRLIVSKEPIVFDLQGGKVVTFKQSDYLVERSPLLAELASFVSYYVDATASTTTTADPPLMYAIEYLAINRLSAATRPHRGAAAANIRPPSYDPFKLPAGFVCLGSDSGGSGERRPPSTSGAFRLDGNDGWAQRLPIRSDRASANLHALSWFPAGVGLVLDARRRLFRLDIGAHSRSVVDMQHKLVYHMPAESLSPPPSTLSSSRKRQQRQQNRNQTSDPEGRSACTIMVADQFMGGSLVGEYFQNKQPHKPPTSLDRWRFFVGNTNSIMHLGLTRYTGTSHLAHEFELLYSSPHDLPPVFLLLTDQRAWLSGESGTSSQESSSNATRTTEEAADRKLLLAKLWISADSCSLLSSPLPTQPQRLDCEEPILLGFQVSLIDSSTLATERGDKIQFSQFQWDFLSADADGAFPLASADALQAFDLSQCPLNKTHLSLEVKWSQASATHRKMSPAEKAAAAAAVVAIDDDSLPCADRESLDDLVAGQLVNYLHTFASTDVELVSLERLSFPGTRVAKYSISLAETPRLAIGFSLQIAQVEEFTTKRVRNHLIGRKSGASWAPFECLGWAGGQFGAGARWVLHSSDSGECLVYEDNEGFSLSSDEGEDDEAALASSRAGANSDTRQEVAKAYALYERRLEELEQPNRPKIGGLKLLVSEHLDAMNQAIASDNRNAPRKQREACVGSSLTLASDIWFGRLRIEPVAPLAGLKRDALGGGLEMRAASIVGYRFTEAVTTTTVAPADGDGQEQHKAGKAPFRSGSAELVSSRTQEVAVSFVQCLGLCNEEPTCASFAYCRYPESTSLEFCQLSDLRPTNLPVEAARGQKKDDLLNDDETDKTLPLLRELTRDAGCEIHAKDYLQYFQPDAEVGAPGGSPLEIQTAARWPAENHPNWRPASGADAASDQGCARLCYSKEAPATCMRLVFCPAAAAEQRCFHWLTTTASNNDDVNSTQQKTDLATNTATAAASVHQLSPGCTALKRKSLTLYKRTIWSSSSGLNWVAGGSGNSSTTDTRPANASQLVQSTVEHLSKEECAERCSEDLECRSFDWCLVVMGAGGSGAGRIANASSGQQQQMGTFARMECTLLSKSIFDGLMLLNDDVGGGGNGGQQRMTTGKGSSGRDELGPIRTASVVQRRRQCSHYERLIGGQEQASGLVVSEVEGTTISQGLGHGQTQRQRRWQRDNNSNNKDDDGSQLSAIPYATTLLSAALLGLVFGFGCNWLIALWRAARRRRSGSRRARATAA